MLTTWSNLFNGYNVYGDVAAHTTMYSDAAAGDSFYNMYHQLISHFPTDFQLLLSIYFSSVVPIVVFAFLIFILFLPLFKRPQRW